MQVTAVGQSDTGKKRKNNEDAFFVDHDRGLFVVADGMGGHKGGEVASRIAIHSVARALPAAAKVTARPEGTAEELCRAIEDAVTRANADILEHARAEPELSGMGCALTLMLCAGPQAVVGHVGDTRLYLRRGGAIDQLTNDHTFVGELVRSGTVSREDMRRHPHGHVLTRALGAKPEIDVDTRVIDLSSGDRFLLCSDGLTNYVENAQALDALLGVSDLRAVPGKLIRWANDAGGGDNVTVVVVDVSS